MEDDLHGPTFICLPLPDRTRNTRIILPCFYPFGTRHLCYHFATLTRQRMALKDISQCYKYPSIDRFLDVFY